MADTDRFYRKIRNITLLGLISNLLLAAGKFAAGHFGHSQALVADAIHSLSDSVTDIAVLIGAFLWNRPADADHPYGHGRFETFVTLFIGGMLGVASIGIGVEAIHGLATPATSPPEFIALLAAFFSIVCKEGLYRITRQASRDIRSPALHANAWHHRLDAASSIPAFLAVAGTLLFPGLPFLDAAGALVVAVFIFQAAVRILLPNLKELLDAGAAPETCEAIRKAAETDPDVHSAHAVRTRFHGSRLLADLHLVVDGRITVCEAHVIAERVRNTLVSRIPLLTDVVIHTEPPEVIPFDEADRT